MNGSEIINRTGKRFIFWFSHASSLNRVRNKLDAMIDVYCKANGKLMMTYFDDYRKRILNKIEIITKETGMLLHYDEAYRIFMTVKNTQKIEGDIAELGVYTGGSAKIICEAKGNKALHLFDTFEGLPRTDDVDSKSVDYEHFNEGQFVGLLSNVKNLLKGYTGVHFYKGIFPGTAELVKDVRFSFVHMDVDLYSSTLSGLMFFYPRMNKGGVIISHDYINSKGVRKAFDEFFNDKPEPIIELSLKQCLIVKT